MIGTASTTTPTHSDLLLLQKNIKPIYTARLTWNLQINHLERKMIFQTSMIMFPVNLQGCNTNVFFWRCSLSQDSRDTPPSEFYQPTATGSTLEALLQESHVNAGVVRKIVEGPKSISPQVHICVGSVFFGWQATIIFSFLLHKNYKTPKKIRKGCWEKLLQPLLSSSDIAWYDLGGSCWVSNRKSTKTRTAASCHPHCCVSKLHHPTLNESI